MSEWSPDDVPSPPPPPTFQSLDLDTPLADPIPSILTVASLNLLGGASGVGKTSLLAWMATQLRDGCPIFGHPTAAPTQIGYISADRPWADARLWFDAVQFADIDHYSLVDDPKFSTARLQQAKPGVHADLFNEALDQLGVIPGAVVFVDPIALFLGGDLNHYIRVAVGCMNLTRLILRRQICVIGIVHSSKQKGDAKDRYGRLQDRMSGSMAQLGYSATQRYLAGPEEMDSDHHTFHWNPHHHPAETFSLKQDPATGLFQPFDPNHRTAAAKPDVLDPELHAIFLLVPPEPDFVTFPSLLTQLGDRGMNPRTLNRRLRELKDKGLLINPKKGRWSRLAASE